MGQRDFGFLLVPFLALIAFLLPSAGSSGKPDSSPAETGVETTVEDRPAPLSNSAASLIADFYGPLAPQSRLTAQDCLIATVPDPIDGANLSYTYDRYIDAIQRAMEAAGYVLDRFDLPWLDSETRAGSQTGAGLATEREPRFRREPGRILFRRALAKAAASKQELPPVAVVFVVGETPTAGIHKVAFKRALDELSATCDTAAQNVVKVLGPSFSGSEVSLHALLASEQRQFNIISGSATAVSAGLVDGADGSTFNTTVATDTASWSAYARMIASREETRPFNRIRHLFKGLAGPEYPTRIAILAEGNTGYGQSAADNWGTKAADQAVSGLRPNEHSIQLIKIPFPLHISSLRAAVRDDDNARKNEAEEKTRAKSLTHLNIREALSSRATIPLMSQIENSSIDVVLTTLLEDLEKEHIRYVGLVATDVRDRVFLAEQIRHHLPNSVLFVFNGDLLYAHPDVNLDLRGTQIVTTYPLFAPNHDWTPAGSGAQRRLLFATQTAQGVYNAVLALVGAPEQMQEYGYPFNPSLPVPLWVSIVGNNRVLPVGLLTDPNARQMVPRMVANLPPESSRVPLPYHPWLPTLALVMCVLPAIFVFCSFTARGERWLGAHFGSGPLAEIFSDTVYDDDRVPRRLCLYSCWTALTSSYLLIVAVFLLPVRTDRALAAMQSPVRLRYSALAAPLQVLLVAGGVVMLFTLALLAWHLWQERSRKHSPVSVVQTFARGTLAAMSSVLVVLSAWVAYRWLTKPDPAESVLLYWRASDFATGVSPLFPLVLVSGAGVAWAISALRRLRLIEGPDRYPYDTTIDPGTPNSFLGLEGPSFEGITALERGVLDAIGRKATALPWTVLLSALGTLVIAWARLFGPRSIPTGEGAGFDSLFALGFLGVYAALTLSFMRFVSIWRRLFRLLQRLAWHPTVKAYARLKEAIPGKPRVNLAARSQIFTALEFSVDRAGALVTLGRDLVKERTPASLGSASTLDTAKLLAAERQIAEGTPHESAAAQEVRETLTINLRRILTDRLEPLVLHAQQELHAALDAEARGDWRAKVLHRTEAEQQLSLMAREVTRLVRPAWRLPSTGAPERCKDDPNEFQWFELAEDFLTSRVAAFLSHVVPQLQNLVVFVTAGLLMMLLAVTSYPFQPHQLLLLFNTAVILAIVGVTFVVFIQMERETILSVLSDSEPGKVNLNRDFISRVVVYVGVPIISLLGAQFPEVAQQLFSWTSSFFGTH